jgi:hypothetical protein
VWNVDVVHQALSSSCWTSGCAIDPGGSISLATSRGDIVTGSFTAGSVKLVRQASGCGKQIFQVVGDLSTTKSSAVFDVALTHYRVMIFGSCISYSATIGADSADGIPGTLGF